jgi:hypothetical protein
MTSKKQGTIRQLAESAASPIDCEDKIVRAKGPDRSEARFRAAKGNRGSREAGDELDVVN